MTQERVVAVEIGFLSDLAAESGRSRFQMKILASLTPATIALSIDQACATLPALIGIELFNCVIGDAQQDARLAQDVLNSLGKATEPSLKCFA